jgi:hypothetical protein
VYSSLLAGHLTSPHALPTVHFGLFLSPFPASHEDCMSNWKVLFIMLLAAVCFSLAGATLVVPLARKGDEYRWVWFGGLLFGTVLLGTLFTAYLRIADRTYRR